MEAARWWCALVLALCAHAAAAALGADTVAVAGHDHDGHDHDGHDHDGHDHDHDHDRGRDHDERRLLPRTDRAAKNRETCRYVRGAWSECDPKSNVRSRTLTLKKGDPTSCERAKTIQKKCKKACRYEKSSWSECSPNGEMSRTDMLKANSDPSCEQSRRVTKKCNKNKQLKSTKDKGRRNRQ